MKGDPTQPLIGAVSSAEREQHNTLNDLINEVRRSMEKKYDPRHVARVAAILAEQIRGKGIDHDARVRTVR